MSDYCRAIVISFPKRKIRFNYCQTSVLSLPTVGSLVDLRAYKPYTWWLVVAPLAVYCWTTVYIYYSPLIRRHLFNHLLWSAFQSAYTLHITSYKFSMDLCVQLLLLWRNHQYRLRLVHHPNSRVEIMSTIAGFELRTRIRKSWCSNPLCYSAAMANGK